MLELVDLDQRISKQTYKERLPGLQRRLLALQQTAWEAQVASILVFEGWDASGKGPCIRKLTERLEPRGFSVHHVLDTPRSSELGLPWLRHFWLALPRYGEMAIFDRSWNRRALVERVEGGADELRWRRALRDIGELERSLADDGYVFVKLFLHISEEERQRRYEAWRKDPGLSWKALAGEWQSPPAHYGPYLEATEELLQHTEAPWSPWTIVPATDQRLVRITAFEHILQRLEAALVERGVAPPELSTAETGEAADAAEES